MSSDRRELTAIVSAAPGQEDALRETLVHVARESRKEAGCVELRVFERSDAPGTFVLWEIFESAGALGVHEEMPYMKAYFASSLVATRDVIWQRLVDG